VSCFPQGRSVTLSGALIRSARDSYQGLGTFPANDGFQSVIEGARIPTKVPAFTSSMTFIETKISEKTSIDEKETIMPTEQGYEWIKRRAYSLWEEAGRPHGRDQDHWNQAAAEREDLERTRASVDGKEILVKYKRKSGIGKKAEAQSLSKSNGTT
jgi:hypothetical protein